MNAVEIEEAVGELVAAPFDADEFAFAFLMAFGNPETTIKRLRKEGGKGGANRSDVPGAVLQRSNIHILVTPQGGRRGRAAGASDEPPHGAAKGRVRARRPGRHVRPLAVGREPTQLRANGIAQPAGACLGAVIR